MRNNCNLSIIEIKTRLYIRIIQEFIDLHFVLILIDPILTDMDSIV